MYFIMQNSRSLKEAFDYKLGEAICIKGKIPQIPMIYGFNYTCIFF